MEAKMGSYSKGKSNGWVQVCWRQRGSGLGVHPSPTAASGWVSRSPAGLNQRKRIAPSIISEHGAQRGRRRAALR